MMFYRNVKTGATIKSACKITGESWEPVGIPTEEADNDEKAAGEFNQEETNEDHPQEENEQEPPATPPKQPQNGKK